MPAQVAGFEGPGAGARGQALDRQVEDQLTQPRPTRGQPVRCGRDAAGRPSARNPLNTRDMSTAVLRITRLATSVLNLMYFSWSSGSLVPIVAFPKFSHLAKPLKDSIIVVALLTCPRTTGSEM